VIPPAPQAAGAAWRTTAASLTDGADDASDVRSRLDHAASEDDEYPLPSQNLTAPIPLAFHAATRSAHTASRFVMLLFWRSITLPQ
jgi:hypothetical protein